MVKDNMLIFNIKNKISHSKRMESTNKRMENVAQVLNLHYADSYELKRKVEDDFYCIELRMGMTGQLSQVEVNNNEVKLTHIIVS